MELAFRVNTDPVAQPRQRHSAYVSHDMSGKGVYRCRVCRAPQGRLCVRNYIDDDHPIHLFKADAQQAMRAKYQGLPVEDPVILTLGFIMPRPQYLMWKTKPMPRRRHTAVPDCDNLEKALMDAATGILWRDDAQVCEQHVRKFVASAVWDAERQEFVTERLGVLVKIATVDVNEPAWVFPRKLPAVCPSCCARAIEMGIAVAGEACQACSGLFAEVRGDR